MARAWFLACASSLALAQTPTQVQTSQRAEFQLVGLPHTSFSINQISMNPDTIKIDDNKIYFDTDQNAWCIRKPAQNEIVCFRERSGEGDLEGTKYSTQKYLPVIKKIPDSPTRISGVIKFVYPGDAAQAPRLFLYSVKYPMAVLTETPRTDEARAGLIDPQAPHFVFVHSESDSRESLRAVPYMGDTALTKIYLSETQKPAAIKTNSPAVAAPALQPPPEATPTEHETSQLLP